MGMTTLRQAPPERPAQSVYWRRRFLALIVGLAALALVTWAFAGALHGSGSPPAAPARSPSVAPPSGAASGQATPATSSQQSTGTVAGGRTSVRACAASDVVLSLFSSQASYSARETPAFEVDVVSTASRPCTFDIGARHVLLQITLGRTTVWSSADCAEGQASLVTKLHRGIPTVVPISWNGQHSSAGCPVPGSPAAAGTYTATATDGSATSNPLAFRIG